MRLALCLSLFIALMTVLPALAAPPFVNFETPQVHPIALSPDGRLLAVANTADNRLEVFDVESGRPVHEASIFVGLDPVSVRFLNNNQVWVVNHISDSVSVVHVRERRIITTLQTLDEPADVVFAGRPRRAYITCSQVDKVMVFDPSALGQEPQVIDIEGEDPRALAVSPDGLVVYAAIFESGNRSTALFGGLDIDDDDIRDINGIVPGNTVADPVGPYGGVNPPPNAGNRFDPPLAAGLPAPPPVAHIVKESAQGRWRDDNGRDWTRLVRGPDAALSGRPTGWQLIDHDVAVIDTRDQSVRYIEGLMNIVMALGVNPRTGTVMAVGTDAVNEVRFEPNLNGIFLRVHAGLADPGRFDRPRVTDLNPHLDYKRASVPQRVRDKSIGDPRGIAWDPAGRSAYVTGMGSNNLVVIDLAGQRRGRGKTIEVGQGPTGVVFDARRDQLYVLNRFDASISVVNPRRAREVARVRFFDPTPSPIRQGRPHLYDTHANSGLGHTSCGSCHVDARMDRLAWDLGSPSGELKSMNDQNMSLSADDFFGNQAWHPMKGPMTTQTLQDIIGHEPHHWRGDRDGLEEFAGAFEGLLGDDAPLPPGRMQQFERFLATIRYPPNPFRGFDNSLPANLPLDGHFTTGRFSAAGAPLPNGNAVRGLEIYRTAATSDDDTEQCVACHSLPTGAGTPGRHLGSRRFEEIARGPNGEAHLALIGDDASVQLGFKIPHLRNLYDKVGFEMTQPRSRAGFGFLHDGTVDSLSRFMSVFDVDNDQQVADLVALLLSFSGSDFGPAPASAIGEPPGSFSKDVPAAVGRQVTIANAGQQSERIAAMIAEARSGAVDLVVKVTLSGIERGGVYRAESDDFLTDEAAASNVTLDEVLSLATPVSRLTFTVVPQGSGTRIGIDRNRNGVLDFDE